MSVQIISAVPVPFAANGDLDPATYETALEALADHVSGVLVAGTTGEFPALDDDERLELFGRAARTLGTARVIAHVGHGSARQVLRIADAARELGIERFALLTPYYLPTDDDGVVELFQTFTRAHPDVVLYGYVFPERTGVEVAPDVLERVMRLPAVAGVKLSGRSAARIREYAAVLRPGQELYSGDDATLPRALAEGAAGVVSGVSSAFPATFSALARALDAGDDVKAREIQAKVVEIVSLVGPTIRRLKVALAARHGGTWASRMALPAVDDATVARIQNAVTIHG